MFTHHWPIFACLPIVIASLSGTAFPATLDLETEHWREDLSMLAAELPKLHVKPFVHVSEEGFRGAVIELDARLQELEDFQVLFEMCRIVAVIGDGHTALRPYQVAQQVRRLPLDTRHFGKEPRIIAAEDDFQSLLGQRIVRVGDTPIEEVYAAEFRPRDRIRNADLPPHARTRRRAIPPDGPSG